MGQETMSLTVCFTHDVDRVYKSYQYFTHDLMKKRFANLKSILLRDNPYWLFETIMSIEERHQVRSTFFFLEESIPFDAFSPKSWKLSLGKYKFSSPKVAEVINRLDANGWEIGLHGSYNSYRDSRLLVREKASLENVLGKPIVGIRQHYLNLDIPDTWVKQKNAGFLYDSSFGLKDKVGFPNKSYHPFINQESSLYILPLALMDGYLFSISKNLDDAWNKCLTVIDEAERNCAVMVALWHQRVFDENEFPGYRIMYEKLIVECKRRGAKFMLCKEVLRNKEKHV